MTGSLKKLSTNWTPCHRLKKIETSKCNVRVVKTDLLKLLATLIVFVVYLIKINEMSLVNSSIERNIKHCIQANVVTIVAI